MTIQGDILLPHGRKKVTYKILICDDDHDIRKSLAIYLKQESYCTLEAKNGREALEIMKTNDIHLIILDIMMPELDGISAAINLREFSNVPIIFLSAKSEETDKILGLKMGGDDYITKPFQPIELMARVESVLRRYARLGGLTETDTHDVYQTGDLILNDRSKTVNINGKEVILTAREYKILLLLMKNMNQILSSSQIYEAVWEEPAIQETKTVSVHIRHIREKIEAIPKKPEYIKVVYGLGYKVVKVL